MSSFIRTKLFTKDVFIKSISMRAGIEGSISRLKIGQSMANLWVRGKHIVTYYVGFKTIAIRVKKLYRYQGSP